MSGKRMKVRFVGQLPDIQAAERAYQRASHAAYLAIQRGWWTPEYRTASRRASEASKEWAAGVDRQVEASDKCLRVLVPMERRRCRSTENRRAIADQV